MKVWSCSFVLYNRLRKTVGLYVTCNKGLRIERAFEYLWLDP